MLNAMTVHLLKLCVGCDSLEDLRDWQQRRLAQRKKRGEPPVLQHVTRSMPKRRDEVLDGGSLYWVIKGVVRVRQRIVGLEPTVGENGVPHCAIVYDPELIAVAARPHRPFQGWRYLEPEQAPPDVQEAEWATGDEPPPGMLAELRELGLV
jgi:hypothetical protein